MPEPTEVELERKKLMVVFNRGTLDCYVILIYNLWFKVEVKMPLDPTEPIEFAS
ncbi:MAG: hypothetical protein ACXWFB_08285 [Nitrososphaeraceae archaeon]